MMLTEEEKEAIVWTLNYIKSCYLPHTVDLLKDLFERSYPELRGLL